MATYAELLKQKKALATYAELLKQKKALDEQLKAAKAAEAKAKAVAVRDPRLPPVGTVLARTKKVVAEDGTVAEVAVAQCRLAKDADTGEEVVLYAPGHPLWVSDDAGDGAIRAYKSLSGAAVEAAKDLGLKTESQNGFAFWQVRATPAQELAAYMEKVLRCLATGTTGQQDAVLRVLFDRANSAKDDARGTAAPEGTEDERGEALKGAPLADDEKVEAAPKLNKAAGAQ